MTEDMARAAVTLKAAGATDRGRVRERNEDEVLLREDLGLYAVFDGAGGHQAGDIAAGLARRTLEDEVARSLYSADGEREYLEFGITPEARALSLAIHRANAEVGKLSQASEAHRGMGSTVVAVLYAPEACALHVAHLGDSRCYRLRSGHLEALTVDHRLLGDILEARPDVPPNKLGRLPKNAVTRALGMTPSVRVPMMEHRVLGGDRFLLCSDGLCGPVEHDELCMLLARDQPVEERVELLIEAANRRGGPDNVAALVIDCAGEASERNSQSGTPDEDRYDPELLIVAIEELDVPRQLLDSERDVLDTLIETTKRK